jgi:hypothetical protein
MILRASLALLCAAALSLGIYSAALRGLADTHYTNARLILADSVANKRAARPEELSVALASVRQALVFEPSNPLFVEQSARLQELRALGLPARDPGIREGLRNSLAQYREAAAMRPGSPYVWASIALLKVRLNDVDFEFYGALERAGRLGPWEPQVQIAMIDVGLAIWPWLAGPGRDWVLGALDRGMQRQEAEIRRIAAVHGTLPELCKDATRPSPRIVALCVKK